MLSQKQTGNKRVIAYYNKTLSPPEKNYFVTRRELLATVKAIKYFRSYLYEQKFWLRTDHISLRWLWRRKEPSNQVARWLEILAEISYSLEHWAEQKHGNTDGLSRLACNDCRQCELIERRDGGTTRQELDGGEQAPALNVARLDGPLQGRKITRESLPRPLNKEYATNGTLLSALKATEEENIPPDDLLLTTAKIVTRTAQTDLELVEEQAAGTKPVAVIYQALLNWVEVAEKQLEMSGIEVKRLHRKRDSLLLRPGGVLEARLGPQGKPRWCALCAPAT